MTSKFKKRSISLLFLLGTIITSISITQAAEEIEQPVELETGFYYTVKKGDTLWDLSQKFSNTPWVWPELWGDNQNLKNPHWIYPGQRIKLHLRKDLEVVKIPVIEPKTEVKEPEKEMPSYYYPKIDSVGFIRREAVSPSASIFKVKNNMEMISQNDLVYIRPMNGTSFVPGTRYFIYKTFKPLKKGNTQYGVQHYITGIVEVTKVEKTFALARVTHSFRTIRIDDLLMPYQKRTPKISLVNSVKNLEGEVIISEEGAKYFGDNSIAFIDKGKKDGVEMGQMYSIYYQEKTNLPGKKNIMLTPIDFGSLIVVHSELDTSTVLITYSEKSVTPGSKIHTKMN